MNRKVTVVGGAGNVGATVALAWPLVLTNLTQSLIQSTDVVLLGWAGARTTSRPRSPGLDENATVPP